MVARDVEDLRSAAKRLDVETIAILLASVLFALPLWLGAHPPMADYPQHLSLAAILRWYHDPARHLVESYALAVDRPNSAFVFLSVGLSYVMSLAIAGKLLISLSVVATGLAGRALARHAGRPGWFGLFALLASTNYAFFFGFVNYVMAIPLLMYGVVLADRILARGCGLRAWFVLAGYAALFYFVHLQVLFIFAGLLLWLALVHAGDARARIRQASAALPALALAAYHFLTRHPESFRYHEKRIYTADRSCDLLLDRLLGMPRYLFGEDDGHGHWWVFLLFALALVWLIKFGKPGSQEGSAEDAAPWTGLRQAVHARRLSAIAVGLLLGFLFLPSVLIGNYIYQRLLALVAVLLPALLPRPQQARQRPAQLLLTGALLIQTVLVGQRALAMDQEAAEGHELIARAEPGKRLMSLVLFASEMTGDSPPLLQHFAAHYLASKGGRINNSFTELYLSTAQLRPGLDFEDLQATVPAWAPETFRFEDFGYHFDYFLFHGDFAKLGPIFGPKMANMSCETRGEWALLWRKHRPSDRP